jgi:hypothetical protein
MSFHRLKVFDPIYDGNYILASRIVNVVIASKNFTLLEYPGQDNFYVEYLSKYDDYVKELLILEADLNAKWVASGYEAKSTSDSMVTENIRSALNRLADEGRLNFGHLTLAFLWIFKLIDQYNGRYDYRFIVLTGLDMVNTKDNSIATWYETLIAYAERYPTVVPFTSPRGTFGFNTYFYLFLNGNSPIACGINSYPVHDDQFGGNLIAIAGHDFNHSSQMFLNTNKEYYSLLKVKYLAIINSDLPDQQIKAMILILYIQVHERGKPFVCDEPINHRQLDEIPFMRKNTYYTEDRLITTHSERRRTNSEIFCDNFITTVQRDICRLFGE